jgi:hypothetical protein
MREQAKALMAQVGAFKITASGAMTIARPPAATLREPLARTSPAVEGESGPSADLSPKSEFTARDQKFAAPVKGKRREESAGVAAGNGKECRMEEEFEEF